MDVMIERLREASGDLHADLGPLFDALAARRETARERLMEALRSARYVALLDRLVEAIDSPALTAAADSRSADVLPALVRRSWKQLRQKAKRLEATSPDEEYHRVRILAKRARYGAEAVAPALGKKRGGQAERFADRAADLQDELGELHDSAVARQMILEVARDRPEAGSFDFAAGRLAERELHAEEHHRDEFPSVWKRLDRKKNLSWM
jgi:CHAD domain-containing protein